MSLDALYECSFCKAHAAARMWVQLYGSLSQAKACGKLSYLSGILPGPVIIKVEVCFSCRQMAPLITDADYTEEERKEMEQYNVENKVAIDSSNALAKILGFQRRDPDGK